MQIPLPPEGLVLNIAKPPGPTSHDIVDAVRRLTGERTVGHAGTLDPFAEGVLVVLVGRGATKRQAEFLHADKSYVATLRFGATSDTHDPTGRITEMQNAPTVPEARVREVLARAIGTHPQVPPAHAAIKIGGKKAYEFARRGESLILPPRTVRIDRMTLVRYDWPTLEIAVDCGSGTYIRALARDIGEALGVGAYLERLVRTRVGAYTLATATPLAELARLFSHPA